MKKISLLLVLLLTLTACNNNQTEQTSSDDTAAVENNTEQIQNQQMSVLTKDDITTNETLSNENDGQHVIEADNQESDYSNIYVYKTGEADGDEADFYGENAAIFATNGATLNLSEIVVETNGTINISDTNIKTTSNNSGAIMVTGGGTLTANNVTAETDGNSSAPIRSDRGGGTVTVDGGSYVTDGKGSPVVYSTADITVSNAYMESTSSQGIVVEGQNSVTLNNVELVASNISKNSDNSDYYQAVMIYQSMSGDADEGLALFEMNDSKLTNTNGDIFFVNNTVATINLKNNEIINTDSSGIFLRAQAAGWGSEGSNGGHVTMNLDDQDVEGDIYVDEVSSLNLYLNNNSNYVGNITNEGQVYVELDEDSTWTLTGDSYVTSLTCSEGSINLNGYKLYVDGQEYVENTAVTGEAIVVEIQSSNSFKPDGKPGDKPDGKPGDKPDGKPGEGGPQRP